MSNDKLEQIIDALVAAQVEHSATADTLNAKLDALLDHMWIEPHEWAARLATKPEEAGR